MRESLLADGTSKWLLARVNTRVFLEMMLKLERFLTKLALELAQLGTLIMRQGMSLQAMQILELLVALFALESH